MRLGDKEKRTGGISYAAILLKLIWLLGLAFFFIFISMTINFTQHANHSEVHHQLQRKVVQAEKSSGMNATILAAATPAATQINTILSKSKSTKSSTSTEDALLKWLRKQHRRDISTASYSISQLLKSSPIHFTPGTLPISQLSALQKCYTNTTIFGQHFKERTRRRAPYSEKHKLAYILLPKSGSSTGRFMMQRDFHATEKTITIEKSASLKNIIAFVREPLSRFYSQYDEAYVRTAPWHPSQNRYYIDPDNIHDETLRAKHPFPYLFEDMDKYHDYEDAFCPPSKRKRRGDCVSAESQENGTLASRLERFVQDYDGRSPFDIHLALQVPMLSNIKDGKVLYITELHNTTNSERDWNALAKKYIHEDHVLENAKNALGSTKNTKNTKETGGVIQGRSYPRRFNVTLVSEKTQRRICELALLDYCCLNFPLPDVCAGDDGDSALLSCKMDYDEANESIRIQPSTFPDKAIKKG